jgi:hypothetical protein
MALDLLELRPVWDADCGGRVEAAYLVARLCEEAGVCLHDAEGNRVLLEAATWEFGRGLVVTDGQGRSFRLRVTAEPLPPS